MSIELPIISYKAIREHTILDSPFQSLSLWLILYPFQRHFPTSQHQMPKRRNKTPFSDNKLQNVIPTPVKQLYAAGKTDLFQRVIQLRPCPSHFIPDPKNPTCTPVKPWLQSRKIAERSFA